MCLNLQSLKELEEENELLRKYLLILESGKVSQSFVYSFILFVCLFVRLFFLFIHSIFLYIIHSFILSVSQCFRSVGRFVSKSVSPDN